MFAGIPIIYIICIYYIQIQLRKNIDAAYTYTNTAKRLENKEKAQS